MNWKKWLAAGFLTYRALKGEGSMWEDPTDKEPKTSLERPSTEGMSGEMSGDVGST